MLENIADCDFVFIRRHNTTVLNKCFVVESRHIDLFFLPPDSPVEFQQNMRDIVTAAIPQTPVYGVGVRPLDIYLPHGPGHGRPLPVSHGLDLLSTVPENHRNYWVVTSPPVDGLQRTMRDLNNQSVDMDIIGNSSHRPIVIVDDESDDGKANGKEDDRDESDGDTESEIENDTTESEDDMPVLQYALFDGGDITDDEDNGCMSDDSGFESNTDYPPAGRTEGFLMDEEVEQSNTHVVLSDNESKPTLPGQGNDAQLKNKLSTSASVSSCDEWEEYDDDVDYRELKMYEEESHTEEGPPVSDLVFHENKTDVAKLKTVIPLGAETNSKSVVCDNYARVTIDNGTASKEFRQFAKTLPLCAVDKEISSSKSLTGCPTDEHLTCGKRKRQDEDDFEFLRSKKNKIKVDLEVNGTRNNVSYTFNIDRRSGNLMSNSDTCLYTCQRKRKYNGDDVECCSIIDTIDSYSECQRLFTNFTKRQRLSF